jgi:hypothetical protein
MNSDERVPNDPEELAGADQAEQACGAAKYRSKALDVHRHIATKITLDQIITVDGFTDLQNFGIAQLKNAL